MNDCPLTHTHTHADSCMVVDVLQVSLHGTEIPDVTAQATHLAETQRLVYISVCLCYS